MLGYRVTVNFITVHDGPSRQAQIHAVVDQALRDQLP